MNLWGIIKGLLVQEESDRTKQLSLEVDSSSATGTRTTLKSAQTADRAVNIPDADDTLVGKATTDVLTNKSIDGDNNPLSNVDLPSIKTQLADAGKFIERDGLGNAISGHVAPGGVVVGDTDTQTLTNKSVDADNNTITNLENDNIKAAAAIDATKIANGSVDNTKFQYLSNLSEDLQASLDAKQSISEKGQANGYASLDGGGLVPSAQLPSFVDDVLEFADFASFPATGESGKIYIATDTNFTYRWGGTVYVQIASAGGADQDLSNLTATSINEDLVPDVDSTRSIGQLVGKRWSQISGDTLAFANATLSENQNNLGITSQRIRSENLNSNQNISLDSIENSDVDAVDTGTVYITSGNKTAGTGDSGDIHLQTGTSVGGNRGIVRVNASALGMDNGRIENLANPTFDKDGANKLYVDTKIKTATNNYITNPNAEDSNANGWNVYNDVSGAVPVDGTGGSPSISIGTGLALRGVSSLFFNKPGSSRQGQGISSDFTIDNFDREKLINVSFDYQFDPTSGTYEDGDMVVYVYDVDNSQLLGTVKNPDDGAIANSQGEGSTFTGAFQATDSSNYRLIFHIATASTEDYEFRFDRVKVSPVTSDIFNAIENAVDRVSEANTDFLPAGMGTGSGSFNYYQTTRVGDSLRIRFFYVKDGSAGSGSSAVEFPLPDGLTAKADAGTNIRYSLNGMSFGLNHNVSQDTGADQFTAMGIRVDNQRMVLVRMGTGSSIQGSHVAAGSFIFVDMVVPIEGWSATNVVKNSELSILATRASARLEGASHTANATNQIIPYNTEEHDPSGSYDPATYIFTAKKPGTVEVTANLGFVTNASGTRTLSVYKNGAFLKTLGQISGSAVNNIWTSGTATVDVVAGDTLSMYSFQNSGGNLSYVNGSQVNYRYLQDLSVIGVASDRQYIVSDIQTLPALTWNAATPAGTFNGSYKWIQDGKRVDLWFWFDYSGAGAANTFCFFTLPSDVPTPSSNVTANSLQVSAQGSGGIGNGGSILAPANAQYLIGGNAVYLNRGASTSCNEGHGHITYFVD